MRRSLSLLFLLGACGPESSNEPPLPPSEQQPSPTPSPVPVDAGQVPHRASASLRRCAEEGAPLSTIANAVTRLNALPRPADGPCFIAALPRPLGLVASLGTMSAQPAAGESSPRLFFLLPGLVISAVPDGDGSKVLEFGEWTSETRTLKGEIGLPITAPLAIDAPFTRVLRGTDQTMCATCHRAEIAHPSIPNAFVSAAFKPRPGTLVSFDDVKALHETCIRTDDPSARCAMLHAVFDFGTVTAATFAPEVETFF